MTTASSCSCVMPGNTGSESTSRRSPRRAGSCRRRSRDVGRPRRDVAAPGSDGPCRSRVPAGTRARPAGSAVRIGYRCQTGWLPGATGGSTRSPTPVERLGVERRRCAPLVVPAVEQRQLVRQRDRLDRVQARGVARSARARTSRAGRARAARVRVGASCSSSVTSAPASPKAPRFLPG